MKIYAPDTNFFLQCRPPDQVDWSTVTRDGEVILLVVREVRKELDRLKSGGNQRRAKRARTASALFRRFVVESIDEIELRSAQPRVRLRIAPRPTETELPANYTIDSSDERIVAEVYAARECMGEAPSFLSHDVVPLEDAVMLDLPTQVIPEAWLLEPEPSDADREIGDLKRRMKSMEGRTPAIIVTADSEENECIRLTADYFSPLSESFISAAMRAVRQRYAIADHADTPLIASFMVVSELHRPSPAKWATYLMDHEVWLDDVAQALRDVSQHLNDDPRGAPVTLWIANEGSAGAENLIVRIEARGDFYLVDEGALDAEEETRTTYFRSRPQRPRTQLEESIHGKIYELPDVAHAFDSRLPQLQLQAPDRHSFRWSYERDRARSVAGQCQDFRHGLPADEITLLLERFESGDGKQVRGALDVLVSAGNLAETQKKTFPLVIEAKPTDTELFVRGILKRELNVDI